LIKSPNALPCGQESGSTSNFRFYFSQKRLKALELAGNDKKAAPNSHTLNWFLFYQPEQIVEFEALNKAWQVSIKNKSLNNLVK